MRTHTGVIEKLSDVSQTDVDLTEQVYVLPISFPQQRLWFLDRLIPNNPAFNKSFAVRLKGTLNLHALMQSLNEIARRHETLRTTFDTIDGKLVQIILPTLTLRVPIVDLCRLTGAEPSAETERLTTEEARKPFDLIRGPIVRSLLLRLAEDEHIIILSTHHIASDGWSQGVLRREMVLLYDTFSMGNPSILPDLPIQYGDFAQWQRDSLQNKGHDRLLAHWEQKLAGAPALIRLPVDRPRRHVQSFEGARQWLTIPRHLTDSLNALSQREGVTLFMTLLAAFKTLLYRYTGQTDLVLGSPIANRNRVELESLIGFFVNMLPLRTDVSGNPTFLELLGRVREVNLEAYAHRDLPFERLVAVLAPQRNLSCTPLFQVVFALWNDHVPEVKISGLTLSHVDVFNGTSLFDMTLFFSSKNRELVGTLEYNTDLFNTDTIKAFLTHYETILNCVLRQPEIRLLGIPLEREEPPVTTPYAEIIYERDQFAF